ncbi:MAG TPA: lipoprotein [Clostridia bacterium]|jgi:hypothetical protein|nr:lipoprotein [Clostridia bacterium]HPY98739.1 lipoprotein [Clostridia bacterium]HQC68387.1 lipoprotein [Clostridia bacterium]
MKKILILFLTAVILLTLTACQTYLFGVYVSEETGRKYEFMNNEFTCTENDGEISGTYVIKNKTITFKYDGKEDTFSYSRDGAAAVIDGVVYIRGQ